MFASKTGGGGGGRQVPQLCSLKKELKSYGRQLKMNTMIIYMYMQYVYVSNLVSILMVWIESWSD